MTEKQPSIPTRQELSENVCWDLTPLYRDSSDWENDFKKLVPYYL